MKRFQFKLEPALKHRKYKEEIKKKELADIFREMKEAQDFFKSLEEDLAKTLVSIEREESIKILDIEKIILFESYMIHLKRLMEQTTGKIAEIQLRVDRKRLEFIEASKAKRVLDRLKEKQYFKYMKEMDTLEQKDIDEMAIVKFLRKQKEKSLK